MFQMFIRNHPEMKEFTRSISNKQIESNDYLRHLIWGRTVKGAESTKINDSFEISYNDRDNPEAAEMLSYFM